jgi:hypothetical protein
LAVVLMSVFAAALSATAGTVAGEQVLLAAGDIAKCNSPVTRRLPLRSRAGSVLRHLQVATLATKGPDASQYGQPRTGGQPRKAGVDLVLSGQHTYERFLR